MNKEIKRQLILTGILLCLIISTLFLWYNNFHFHTYMSVVDYQYCYAGENEDLMIDGYEFYKKDREQKNGQARIMALKDQFLLKGDQIKTTFILKEDQEEYQFQQKIDVKSDNEVCYLNLMETTQQLYNEDFKNAQLHIEIIRDKKNIYNEMIDMAIQNLVIYNGSNKDYTIQNVRVTPSWLKTGYLSSTDKNIDKKYPYMIMDYLYLKDGGREEDINDYERFAYVKGKTKDILDGKMEQIAYYDDQGSLLDKELRCVVTLSTDEKQSQPYTFMIELHGNIKVVD
ncbi:MAG: hypothetical protein ACLUVC_13995 [Longibaculum sp.]